MTGFVILAGLLLVAVVALVLAPIIRTPSEQPRYLTVLATGAGLPAFAIGLYLAIGNFQLADQLILSEASRPTSGALSNQAGRAEQAGPESVEAMVGQLESRLRSAGGSAQEWQMLGRSYIVMGRFGEAVAAFSNARAEDQTDDPELLAQYAEALVLSDQTAMGGEAGQLFEQVLAVMPQEPRSLWYGGIAALQRGDNGLAVRRWESLLEQDPPEELRAVLRARIEEAGGAANISSGEGAAASREPGQAERSGAIKLSVSAPAALLRDLNPQTPVFVLARGELPGPPLAVKRMRVADLPFQTTLSVEDAMMPGRNIESMQATEIVARIALNGSPEASSGDLFGQFTMQGDATAETVRILIDQRVE